MLNAYKKRPDDFKMRVLCYINGALNDLQKEEQHWLDMISEKELSTSKNVMEGCNRYYNMKKNAFGGSHKGHTKNRTKPAWNKGLTPKMLQLRKDGKFSILSLDKPKPKNPNRTGRPKGCTAWNKGKTYKHKSTTSPKVATLHIKHCPICEHMYITKRINQITCSKKCASKKARKKGYGFKKGQVAWNKGLSNPQGAVNGKKSAKKQSHTVTGRKRKYRDDGSWFWVYP